MRTEVNRENTNQNPEGDDYRAFHMVSFRRRFNPKQLRQDWSDPPFLIANMGSMPDKCAARL